MRRPGSIVLALGLAACATGCGSKSRRADAEAEAAAREAFARAAAIDGGIGNALNVTSRADVLFEDGFSIVSYDPPDDYRAHAFRYMGQRGHVRVHSHGDKNMHFALRGWINEKVIRAKPVVTAYLGGLRIADTGAVEDGVWGLDVKVPAELLRDVDWVDVIVTVSAVAFHWGDPPELRVVVINSLEWWETP
jgi:hypothetical protein